MVTVVLDSPDHVGRKPGAAHSLARKGDSCDTAGCLVRHYQHCKKPGPFVFSEKGKVEGHEGIRRGLLPVGAMGVAATPGTHACRAPCLVGNVSDEMFPLLGLSRQLNLGTAPDRWVLSRRRFKIHCIGFGRQSCLPTTASCRLWPQRRAYGCACPGKSSRAPMSIASGCRRGCSGDRRGLRT